MRAKSSRERSVDTAPLPVCRTSDGELRATTCAPRGEHPATGLGLHALAKAVLPGAMALLGLVRLLCHWGQGSFRQAVRTFSFRPACRCGCDRCGPRRGRPLVVRPGHQRASSPPEYTRPPYETGGTRLDHRSGSSSASPPGARQSQRQGQRTPRSACWKRDRSQVSASPPTTVFSREVPVPGVIATEGKVPLLGVDDGAQPGQRVG
jgi:hypothetical protein